MTATASHASVLWMLDSSTFVHALIAERVALIVSLRSPICFPRYVFHFELGSNAHQNTREMAAEYVAKGRIGISDLTLEDLDRIADLSAPRRIGLGEIACAVIAERSEGGVLCDDWRAKKWLSQRTQPRIWESIEEVFLDAASRGFIGEFDLVDIQEVLIRHSYACRYDLRLTHLQRMLNMPAG